MSTYAVKQKQFTKAICASANWKRQLVLGGIGRQRLDVLFRIALRGLGAYVLRLQVSSDSQPAHQSTTLLGNQLNVTNPLCIQPRSHRWTGVRAPTVISIFT